MEESGITGFFIGLKCPNPLPRQKAKSAKIGMQLTLTLGE